VYDDETEEVSVKPKPLSTYVSRGGYEDQVDKPKPFTGSVKVVGLPPARYPDVEPDKLKWQTPEEDSEPDEIEIPEEKTDVRRKPREPGYKCTPRKIEYSRQRYQKLAGLKKTLTQVLKVFIIFAERVCALELDP
jgi:hypothetical protein